MAKKKFINCHGGADGCPACTINGKHCSLGYHQYEENVFIVFEVTLTKNFSQWKSELAIKRYVNKLIDNHEPGGIKGYRKYVKDLFKTKTILSRHIEYITDGLDPEDPRYIGLKASTIYRNIDTYKKVVTPDYYDAFKNDGWDMSFAYKVIDGPSIASAEKSLMKNM